MELQVINDDKEVLELEVKGEDHTLCNLLRNELWNSEDLSFASYSLKHPLIGFPVLLVKAKKGKPKKLLLDAVESLKNKTKELKILTDKI